MLGYKVKAGALQLTLFIAVIIALLLSAFIILVQAHKRFHIQTDFVIETVENANKGIDYVLINSITLNDTVTVNLNSEDYKTLKVHRAFWGLFEKVTTTSTIKTNRFQKVALIGASQPELSRTALFVQDNNRPLVLVGNTKIKGLAYIPKKGIKPGNISGHSYYGSELIYGPIRFSSALPKLMNETIKNLQSIDRQIGRISQNQYLNLEPGTTHINSFLDPLQVVFSPSEINLNAVNLTGHMVVQSNTRIVIEARSNLKDVILIAPVIEIKAYVKGNFQALASEEIRVGKNVELTYPSALVINEKETQAVQQNTVQNLTQHRILIEGNSNIQGAIVYLGQPKPNNYKVQLKLMENSTVYGEVYCNQNIELLGTVFGSVYTNNFIAKQFGSIYQNHIYNGAIDIDGLINQYVGLPFNNSKKGVIKWLY